MTAVVRPRLLPHVLARRHFAGEHRLVVLYDSDRIESHRVGERTWLVLAAMDGTRDVEGLVALATREGATVSAEEVTDLVQDLAAKGMVGEGAEVPKQVAGPSEGEQAPPRPLWHLPGFQLDCDGRGTCCRFYPSIAFSPLDAARARAARPDVLEGGESPDRVFLPLLGSDTRAFGVTLVDGRCAYLGEDLGCSVHRVAGAASKPLGCRTYPARFVDDGVNVRISPWPECRCVLVSGARDVLRGDPLSSPSARTIADLDPAIHIERLPPTILVAPERTAPLAELAAWSSAVFDAPSPDAVASLLTLSRSLAERGLDVEASRAAIEHPPAPRPEDFTDALRAVAPQIERLASEEWRDPKDIVRITANALQDACLLAGALTEDLLAGPGRHRDEERFYVRDIVFGHHAVHKQALRPMSVLVFDRAVRALLGRALAVVSSMAGLEDPAFATPLALVEATMRGYGVNVWVRDLAVETSPSR